MKRFTLILQPMKSINLSSSVSSLRKSALLIVSCAFGLGLVAVPVLKAASPTEAAADAKAPALPLKSSFEKVAGNEKGPFVLKLKNKSKVAVNVTAKVLLAVAFHGEDKARHIPAHSIAAGEVWSIADLAAEDKVVLTAEGFAPLEIVVK
jgi:hypothetical protein